ncbi:hypothetical protein HETIRDRAFT_456627 [Heterobasidion irregulare TC 32-1]|uniref:Amidohydrolase-related domain-containing protein n=1 Tax=Heterobasidion irregulare (strain TC 32-1) TaxID=747525 RepID=W4KNS3_HETIT|nr:uncharacterized protein HETIRDRAFT_456627 [Heterobasidion irregulare TC 32-1]ETW86701.1 hypothetical protein HETIRDRAFT_456627 [Heterobasidion irregulare TC 32-1]
MRAIHAAAHGAVVAEVEGVEGSEVESHVGTTDGDADVDAADFDARSSSNGGDDRGLFRIYAGRLFDPDSLALLANQLIAVSPSSGLVISVRPFDPARVPFGPDAKPGPSEDPRAIDLRRCTVLPGFVDAHVHLFLRPYSEVSWDDQLTRESLVERALRAGVHAKRTLLAGFTTVRYAEPRPPTPGTGCEHPADINERRAGFHFWNRDLGTEGAADADIALRKCLSGPDPLIPGPRYFCANRAIVSTGSYGPKSSLYVNREGIDGVTGAEAADGVAECVKAVRRQVGAGADWIKIYADYRFRSRIVDSAPLLAKASVPLFTAVETRAMIETAHSLGVKVAAHATNKATVETLLTQGIDSIEHGYDLSSGIAPELLRRTSQKSDNGTAVWVPTLAAYYTLAQNQGDHAVWTRAANSFRAALKAGIDIIACGGDTGVFAHGDNALEMQLMVRLGADWRRVLRWATLGGWHCVRSMAWEGDAGKERMNKVAGLGEDPRVVGDNEVPFGLIKRGWAADLIATSGDLENAFEYAVAKNSIVFVMKGGGCTSKAGKKCLCLEFSGRPCISTLWSSLPVLDILSLE